MEDPIVFKDLEFSHGSYVQVKDRTDKSIKRHGIFQSKWELRNFINGR